MQRKSNEEDAAYKESPYYIRQKIEIGVVAEKIGAPWVKVLLISILIVYAYGAMSLKYASGA